MALTVHLLAHIFTVYSTTDLQQIATAVLEGPTQDSHNQGNVVFSMEELRLVSCRTAVRSIDDRFSRVVFAAMTIFVCLDPRLKQRVYLFEVWYIYALLMMI